MKSMILAMGTSVALAQFGRNCDDKDTALSCLVNGCQWDRQNDECKRRPVVPGPEPADALCDVADSRQACRLLEPLGCEWTRRSCKSDGSVPLDDEVCGLLDDPETCLLMRAFGCKWSGETDSCFLGAAPEDDSDDSSDDGPVVNVCRDNNGKPGQSPSIEGYGWSHSGYWETTSVLMEEVDTLNKCAKKCTKDLFCYAFDFQHVDMACFHYQTSVEGVTETIDHKCSAYSKCKGSQAPQPMASADQALEVAAELEAPETASLVTDCGGKRKWMCRFADECDWDDEIEVCRRNDVPAPDCGVFQSINCFEFHGCEWDVEMNVCKNLDCSGNLDQESCFDTVGCDWDAEELVCFATRTFAPTAFVTMEPTEPDCDGKKKNACEDTMGCEWEKETKTCFIGGDFTAPTSTVTAVDTSPVRRLGLLLSALDKVSEMDGDELKETLESFSQAFEQERRLESMDVNQMIQIVIKILQMFMGSMEKGSLTSDEIEIIMKVVEILSSLF